MNERIHACKYAKCAALKDYLLEPTFNSRSLESVSIHCGDGIFHNLSNM